MMFTDIFIKRPVLAVCISLLITLLGLQSLKNMAVRQYPDMTNTVITVTTSYYGAGADLIQGFITAPIEQAVAQADNIDYMTSSSKMGSSTITIYMKLNTDPNGALADVMSRVNSVKSQLPSDAQDPTISLSTGSTTSVLYIAFSSDVMDGPQITDYLNRVVIPQLFTVNGVAKVNLYGGNEYALRIWIDPLKLAAHQLTAQDVVNVLKANNFQTSSGQINNYYTLMNTNTNTQVANADELSELIVASKNGAVVRMKDVAKISMATSHDSFRSIANGQKGVVAAIDATPTANPLDIAAGVTALMPTLEKGLPSTLKMNTIYDSTISIDESINEVIHTIVEAAIIVLVVITLFMGSFRAVVIPIITIPLSMIGVIMLMSLFGFSINLMTLLAMVLAIGLVVDDAIVVVENVDRHIKNGLSPFKAAIIGTREIAIPVISMTITLGAVYSPIALMGGITGSLFTEFALTLAGSVLISGIIALTLSPMMCSKMLKAEEKPGKFESIVNRILNRITEIYTGMLDAVLTTRTPIVIVAIVIMASLPLLFKYCSSELAPYEDSGAFMMMGKAPTNANLDYIEDGIKKLNNEAAKDPAVLNTLGMIGTPASNQGMAILVLKEFNEREKQSEVIKRVSPLLTKSPNINATVFQMPPLPGSSSGLPMQFVLMTPNSFEELYDVSEQVMEKARKSGLFVYFDSDLSYDSPTLYIDVDRKKAGAYGITMSDIGQTLSTIIADGYVNRVSIDGRSYEVIPQSERIERMNPDSLNKYFVKSQSGDMISLRSILNVKVKAEPATLSKMSQQNAATLSFALSPGVNMGEAVSFFENEVVPTLPAGYTHNYKGESRQFTTEGSSLASTFALAVFIIFLVLACQFESWRDPCVILIAVPLAISGALLFLSVGMASLNIYTEVGLITLVGLISKHGILICEVSREEQLKNGCSKIEAVKRAASVRLRPILMTTAAMVAGLVPLLTAAGAGAESRFSIGLVIVAGLSIGTMFTLFVLPVIYSFVGENHKPLPEFTEEELNAELKKTE
ncbi:MAG: multidrug efflux RND transporter permease subunit [Ruminobacter sp.]|uniref:multidrug efflux RND transporter permease subunit n=1 Tax=Ruminobacter sp. TaxID=2774296 RepID=UPI00257C9134|nr:multidrug efflux RND transporter permease subunit [Ruminobacter sp.]MBQ3775791.1 multidrug efflux RND transporter permease subunit [Ruminobacter sp.]